MKILLIEDHEGKAEQISRLIESTLSEGSFDLSVVRSINDAILSLGRFAFDMVIADLVLPQINDSEDTCDATEQWCAFIESERSIRLSTWVVMTSYSDVAAVARETFARHGVAVVEYDENGPWRQVLRGRLTELYVNRSSDFVIICALAKERAGFEAVPGARLGNYRSLAGLDCRELKVGDLRGSIVVLPEPGLVSAAIATTKATALFKPRVVAISGICGGMVGESELGDIITPDVSWNYQTGKLSAGGLVPELMQTPVPPQTKLLLQRLESEETSGNLREGLLHGELKHRSIRVLAMVSGSSVVADENEALKIATQSRKIGGLDMEVSSVFAAAHDFFNGGGAFFAAKVVVDMANDKKDDRYHEYGCVLAARYTVTALRSLGSSSAVRAE
ncbi:hypothetical protein [Sphingomonas sp.]|jgi:nucleoside phosphorylase/CheY-like chemotaxis protein|uniref:phosphorylase family protein n=1 Tax=Sphingomonas sp. TaxID=28214 RepID=UPI002D7F26EC|nr:hypothetical protein [Sphingomonas sp.]HEU0045463.1 hypothetical protein [Sphingomonas sp.]